MKKYAKDRRPSGLKPVEKIELSEKHIGLRVTALVICIAIAVICIITFMFSLLNKEDGYKVIEAKEEIIGLTDEIVFNYNLGASGESSTAEYKRLSIKYTDILMLSYKLFEKDKSFDNIVNIHSINNHPCEVLKVDALLYQAFEKLNSYSSRIIYLAPIFTEYNNLFYSGEDEYAKKFDPYFNEEQAKYIKKLADFASNPSHVDVKLLGNSEIKLEISDEYRSFLNERQIESVIDFSFLRNAFILDFIADSFIREGYVHGSLMANNGYYRSLGNADIPQSLNIFDSYKNKLYTAGRVETSGAYSFVNFKSYAMTSIDERYSYTYKDGKCVTLNIDIKDGKYKHSTDNLLCYSNSKSCVDIVMLGYSVFAKDYFDTDSINSLKSDKGISSIWCEQTKIYTTGDKECIKDLFVSDDIKYEIA